MTMTRLTVITLQQMSASSCLHIRTTGVESTLGLSLSLCKHRIAQTHCDTSFMLPLALALALACLWSLGLS